MSEPSCTCHFVSTGKRKDRLGSDVKSKAGIMFPGGVVYRTYHSHDTYGMSVLGCAELRIAPQCWARERDRSVCTWYVGGRARRNLKSATNGKKGARQKV